MRVTLDIPLSLWEIVNAVGSNSNPENKYINAICTDTREAHSGDLFIALNGENQSGEKYIKEAYEKNCYTLSSSHTATVCVTDTAKALLKIAEYYKSKLNIKYTVSVTGSVGKSTTVKFIGKLLAEKFKVHYPLGNFNNHIGVPLTLLASPKNTEVLITELGMNHKNEISILSKCVHPDIGIITNIGTAHIGNLGSRYEIAKAKLEILDGMSDASLLLPESEALLSNIESGIYIGRNSSLSDFSLNDEIGDEYSFLSPRGTVSGIKFFDKREHLLLDLAFTLSTAFILGMSESEIIRGVKSINEEDLRQRFIVLKNFTIFDDSYNASLESIVADFKFISNMNRPTGAFLGDVLELGDSAHNIHKEIGNKAAEMNIGRLYLYGEYAEDIKHGAIDGGINPNNIFINTDVASPGISVDQIISNHKYGEIILFKASHKLRLHKIADLIKEMEGSNNER